MQQTCICGKKEDTAFEFKRCGRCKIVRYCSPECQKKDWEFHKKSCKGLILIVSFP